MNLLDVIMMADSPNSDRKIKGILKTSNSSPALVQARDQVNINAEPINGVGFRPGKLTKMASMPGGSRSVSFKKTHTKVRAVGYEWCCLKCWGMRGGKERRGTERHYTEQEKEERRREKEREGGERD